MIFSSFRARSTVSKYRPRNRVCKEKVDFNGVNLVVLRSFNGKPKATALRKHRRASYFAERL